MVKCERKDFMDRYCYICGYKTKDSNITECPQCLCDDVFVETKDEEELMVLFDDRELTNAMIELKKNNLVEYKLKLQQLKNAKEQERQTKESKKNKNIGNQPHCPTCGSSNLSKVSTFSKIMDSAVWGFGGKQRYKTYHCNNCGYEW